VNKLLLTWQAATFRKRRAGFALLFSTALLACGSSHAKPAVTAPTSELERVAAQTCENGVMARSKNKSSLDFHHSAAPPPVRKLGEDMVVVLLRFSAKNASGAESGSVAKCVLSADGKKVVVIDIEDASPKGM